MIQMQEGETRSLGRRMLCRRSMEPGDWLWLCYVVFVLLDPMERPSFYRWTLALVSVGLFLLLYVTFFKADRGLRRLVLVASALMGALLMPANAGACSYLIYAAAWAPYAFETSWALVTIAVLAATIAVESRMLHLSLLFTLLDSFFCVIAGLANAFLAQKERDHSKLMLAQEEIEALAAMAERERIARDLHDVLGHTLSVIVLKSELAGRLLDHALEGGDMARLAQARAELGDVERTGRTALQEVREAIVGYRARGLLAEIEAARGVLEAAEVTLRVEAAEGLRGKTEGLTPAQESVLSLALREAVTNIVRHAAATECRLGLVGEGGRLRLCIEDDGVGRGIREGNGLRGMRERVESVGGRLTLESRLGTQLLIELPQVVR